MHSSIGRVWVHRWLYDLKQSGLLIEYIATTKDSLVSYQLNEKFEWTGRWRLFEQARKAWNIKLKSHRSLVFLPTAMTGNDEPGEIKIDIVKSLDKSVSPVSVLTSSHGLGQSVYVRTQMEKRLPPIMAMTVSSSPKKITFNQEKASTLSIRYRADNIYLTLFERLAKSENPGVTRKGYFQLIHDLAKDSGEPADFVFQVLEGKFSYLPVAAKIILFKGRCSVSALLNAVPTYPRTSVFLRSTLGKGTNKFVQPSNDQTKLKVELSELPTLSVKSNLSTASENRLIAHAMPEGKNEIPLQVQRLDEVAEYMQRVASIFKNPSA